MHRWLIAMAFLMNIFISPRSDGVVFNGANTVYKFGEEVTFLINVQPADAVEHLYLFIQPEGNNTRVETVSVNTQGNSVYTYDARQFPLRPFAQTYYWYRAVLSGGKEVESTRYSFVYVDNRFDWQSMSDGNIEVHWYDGEPSFGQDVLNAATSGLDSARSYLPVGDPVEGDQPIRIYVYAHGTDLQQALQLTQQSWVAGHASPDIGTILISVGSGPEQRMELARQIPHEITHLLQYRIVGNNYSKVPVWLLEGAASMAELYPNTDYTRVLDNAKKENSLLSIRSLCSTFPKEASGAFLAYAESESFVHYLYNRYGTTGLLTLFTVYGTGADCEEGTKQVYNIPLDQLDTQWRRETLNMDVKAFALQSLFPYILIALLFLVSPLVMILYFRRK
jgi:hypothetical protein